MAVFPSTVPLATVGSWAVEHEWTENSRLGTGVELKPNRAGLGLLALKTESAEVFAASTGSWASAMTFPWKGGLKGSGRLCLLQAS